MSEEDFNKFLDEVFINGIYLTLKETKEDENTALRNATKYLEKKELIKTPRTFYYIISRLNENERIPFIKEHLDYIKEHDEEIFIYTMLSPSSLSYFLTFQNIKDLYNIDKEIFNKIINKSHENLFHGFSHEEYIEFYKVFKEELNKIENIFFINSLYFHNRCCFETLNLDEVNNMYSLQQSYNKEFITLILEVYEDKIDSFNENEIRNFLHFISDITIFESIIIKYKDKLNKSFENIDTYTLKDFLSELSELKQEMIMKYFSNTIVRKDNIKEIISKLTHTIILDLYNNKKELFEDFTLKDWIQLTSKKRILTQEFKSIIDTYEIINIEELFDIKFYLKTYYREYPESLKYVEQKYRKKLANNKLNPITKETSIFSKEYFENLNYLKLNKEDKEQYKKHFILFLEFIKIYNIDLNKIKEIEILFKKIINGTPISILFEIKTIEEITLINRLGEIEFNPEDFTIEQLKRYNVKKHKQLNKYVENNKSLTLKLMLILGFNNAKKVLEYNNEIQVLEHLVGNVDVKNIKLDKQGEPIVNKRIINMLFEHKLLESLNNKDNDLYKYFPRIFNEWEMIKINGKDKNLSTIIEYLKSDDVSLLPKYHRLEKLFKFIGCSNSIVKETLKLHDEMLISCEKTIPRVKGEYDNYTYEIMRYDDMKSLTVGNITDCCFTVLGVGYQCLRHALTNKNGRVFVIRKDNEIIAHSWVWRNGNHLCFDNIEISKKISKIDFLNIYIEASNKIIEESHKYEKETSITNVTIGYTNYDKKIDGIESFPYLMDESCDTHKYKGRLGNKKIITSNMPKPQEQTNYSDSKNVQILIKGNGDFKSYNPQVYYLDERDEVLHYNDEIEYEKEYLLKIIKIVNSLRYIKLEQENKLNTYETLSIYDLKEIHCNNDWYYIIYNDGYTETFNLLYDSRSIEELEQIEKNKTLCLK